MQHLWIATQNPKKKAELLRLLEPLGVQIHTLAERPGIDWVEDAEDFAGNAEIKAFALARSFGPDEDDHWALGDDSGLAVDALGGRPGVRSARYAGPDATDEDRVEKLLDELATLGAGEPGETDRGARFVCHLSLAGVDGETGEPRSLWTTERTCEGEILPSPRGEGGFGYDPVFLPCESDGPSETRSFAELTPSEKDAISHRGRALRDLVHHIQNAR
ncbi:MAG: non-canonical purine NTP pyrophosphatase [Planctomycetota bacterium]